MNSTNLFSSFLINSEAVFYGMEIEENRSAFVDFFNKTQYMISEDNQFQLMEVAAPMFSYEKGSLYMLPVGLVSNRKQYIEFTPGELLLMDWYADSFMYEYHPQSWCLPCTFKTLSKLNLDLIGQSIQYSCKLIAIDNGFLKEEFMWKRTNLTDVII